MSHSIIGIRHHFRAHRIFNIRVDNLEIGTGSVCAVSLTETGAGGNVVFGRATMKVYNVAPDAGFVNIRGEIDWDRDLPIRADITIINRAIL